MIVLDSHSLFIIEQVYERDHKMKKYLLPGALLLGIVWDILFWKRIPGVSFPIFVIMCLTVGCLLLRTGKIPLSNRSYVLIASTILFSVLTIIRKDFLSSILSYALSLLFLFILTVTYSSGLWISYNVFDYITKFIHLLGKTFSLPWKLLNSTNGSRGEERFKIHKSMLRQIVRGLLLSLPILTIFNFLLTSADLVFAQRLQDFFIYFNIEEIGEYVVRGILIFIIAYTYIGIIMFAAEHSQKEYLNGIDQPVINPFLSFTEVSIILGSVIILFSSFVMIQFRYFFSGQLNIDVYDFTYAEYARRGFGELVAVAVFSMALIQGLGVILKLESTKQRKFFTGLMIVLVLLVLVILVSSFQRLSLYESAYGFSRLRTYSHVFIIWLGLLLVGRIILEIAGEQRPFTNLALLALIGYVLFLSLLNVDSFIVHRNINRAETGAELDTSYLASLTYDAVPALVKEFISPIHSPQIKEDIGAVLKCYGVRIGNETRQGTSWQSFHFSDWTAQRNLQIVQEKLKNFHVLEELGSFQVTSPGGKVFQCHEDPIRN